MKKHILMIQILFLLLIGFGCQSDSITESGTEAEPTKEKTVETSKSEAADEIKEPEEKKKEKTKKQADGVLTVDYIDVGQGDATLFHYKNKDEEYTMLYDTGDWLGDEVVPFLQDKGIDNLDLVIISHPHADHIGQLANVMNNVAVEEVWMSGNEANSEVFAKALTAVLESDADYDEPEAGSIHDLGPLTITVLHPGTLTGNLNEDSLSIHVAFDDTAFLFTGDAYKKQEQMILDQATSIKADFLQLGHHGSNTSNSANFVDAVQPDYAIYSAGKDNTYGHPHEEIVSVFAKKGIPLYGTDVHGTITVQTDGKTAQLNTEKADTEKPKPGKADTTDQQATEEKDSTATDCIDLNEASETDLQDIKHIGEARAKSIIDGRPYEAIEDLLQIKGIGDKILADIKQENKACIGGE